MAFVHEMLSCIYIAHEIIFTCSIAYVRGTCKGKAYPDTLRLKSLKTLTYFVNAKNQQKHSDGSYKNKFIKKSEKIRNIEFEELLEGKKYLFCPERIFCKYQKYHLTCFKEVGI